MSLLSSDNPAQLFGLDLRAVWQDAAVVARAMAARAPLSWLTPAQRVRLHGVDGVSEWIGTSRGLRRVRAPSGGGAGVMLAAIEMRAERVLHHTFSLPPSAVGDAGAAARLEALRLSPFSAQDTVWGFALGGRDSAGVVSVHVSICYRGHVSEALATFLAETTKARPEVWALADGLPVVLQGFGESDRTKRMRAGTGWAVFWLLLALCWLGAIVLTPSLQLRETALNAQSQFAAMGKSASNALVQREALLQSNAKLKEFDDALAQRADPKRVLEVLTNVLDDGVFLQRLEVKNRVVSISGQAANATALIQTLSGVSGIEEVKATAAATRQPNGTERFAIDFVFKPAPATDGTKPSADPPISGASEIARPEQAVKP